MMDYYCGWCCDKLELRLLPTLFVEVSSHSSLPIHTQCMGALKRFEICQFCTDYRIGPREVIDGKISE